MVCPICLDEFEDNDLLVLLPCNHRYHYECIIRDHIFLVKDCPYCRSPLPEHPIIVKYTTSHPKKRKATWDCYPLPKRRKLL